MPAGDGATERDHRESYERQVKDLPGWKRKEPEAEASAVAPDFPDALDYLWEWFADIIDGIPANGMAPVAIGWRDLSAWCEFSGYRLQWWESRLLLKLSALRAQIVMEKAERDRQNKNRTNR